MPEENDLITEGGQLDGLKNDGQRLCPILVIDDEASALELFQKVLGGGEDERSTYGGALQVLEGVMKDEHELSAQAVSESPVKEFSVTVANQGKRGIDLAQQAIREDRPFPIAFIDIRMPPGIDGLETAKALRVLDNRIYIVIMTAYSNTSLKQINEALGYGVIYIRKPFDRQEIQQMAKMLSQNWKKEHKGITCESASDANPAFRMEKSSPAVDDEIDEELIAIFKESVMHNKQRLIRALAEKNWEMTKEVAHTIKDSGASFRCLDLTKQAALVCDAYDQEQFEQIHELTMELIFELGKVLS